MQKFAQYFAEQEIYFNECLSYERERLEEDADTCLEIFRELGCLEDMDEENKLKDQPCSEQAGPLNEEHGIGPGTYIDREGVTDSLQDDVVDIKKQAEETHRHVVSLEDPQEATGWLEKQLGKTTTALTQTKEKLTKKTNELIKIGEQLTQKPKDFEMQMIKSDESAEQLKEPAEKMNTQNKRIQELMDIVEQKDDVTMRLQDLISRLEETMKDSDNTVTTMKRKFTEENSKEEIESSQLKACEETVLEVGRKRSESKAIVATEPPAEKDSAVVLNQFLNSCFWTKLAVAGLLGKEHPPLKIFKTAYASVSGVGELLIVQSYSTCCETRGFMLYVCCELTSFGQGDSAAKGEKLFT
ncbi:uncharacterized protein LOC141950922 [Strix uralensis]|uniref:uncharacterized protein LOC141950922 n=1 Tax=Strix uralensis TaxID=36305 RepID=UPI003DA2E0DE